MNTRFFLSPGGASCPGFSIFSHNALGQVTATSTNVSENGTTTTLITHHTYDSDSGRQNKSFISGKAVLYYAYDKGLITTDGSGNVSLCEVLNSSGAVTACYRYTYDSLGRLIYSSEDRGNITALRTQHKYDSDNRIISQSYQLGGDSFTESYTYRSTDGAMTAMAITTIPRRGSIMYPAVITILRLVGGLMQTTEYLVLAVIFWDTICLHIV